MTDDDLTRRFQAAAATARQLPAHPLTAVSATADDWPDNPADTDDPGVAAGPYCSSLEDWVARVFAPTYARRATPTFRWCAQWWQHPEAISRLEALWRSWETLRLDPLLGMATWYTSHLDAQLPVLTGPAGPFADCDPTRHFPADPEQLAHTPAPTGWWPTGDTAGTAGTAT